MSSFFVKYQETLDHFRSSARNCELLRIGWMIVFAIYSHKDRPTSFVKGPVNVFDFSGYIVSVSVIQLCCCNMEVALDSM